MSQGGSSPLCYTFATFFPKVPGSSAQFSLVIHVRGFESHFPAHFLPPFSRKPRSPPLLHVSEGTSSSFHRKTLRSLVTLVPSAGSVVRFCFPASRRTRRDGIWKRTVSPFHRRSMFSRFNFWWFDRSLIDFDTLKRCRARRQGSAGLDLVPRQKATPTTNPTYRCI